MIVAACGAATDGAEAAMRTLDPPLHFQPGEGLAITCDFEHPGATPLAYGPTAASEMCLVAGVFLEGERDLFGEVPPTGDAVCGVAER